MYELRHSESLAILFAIFQLVKFGPRNKHAHAVEFSGQFNEVSRFKTINVKILIFKVLIFRSLSYHHLRPIAKLRQGVRRD